MKIQRAEGVHARHDVSEFSEIALYLAFIEDESAGAAIPKAAISVKNTGTNFVRIPPAIETASARRF